MGLWTILRRSKGLSCHKCGREILSGIVRFEDGQKVGILCHACSECRDTPTIHNSNVTCAQTFPRVRRLDHDHIRHQVSATVVPDES